MVRQKRWSLRDWVSQYGGSMCLLEYRIVLFFVIVVAVLRDATGLSFGNRLTLPINTAAKSVLTNRQNRGTTVPTPSGSLFKVRSRHRTLPKDMLSIDPTDPFTFGFRQIGKVVGAHGVRGEIKVLLEQSGGDRSVVAKDSVVYVRKPNRKTPRPVRVTQCRRQGSKDQAQHVLLLQLEGVTTRTMAEAFTKYVLYVRHDDVAKLQSNEYLVRDLVGLDVFRLEDMAAVQQLRSVAQNKNVVPGAGARIPRLRPIARVVGVVPPEELCDSPAAAKLMHAQLELRLLRGERQRPPYRHCLVPLVPNIVRTVDVEHACLFLDPPHGLLEMTFAFEEKSLPLKGFLPAVSSSLSAADREYLAQRCKEQPMGNDAHNA